MSIMWDDISTVAKEARRKELVEEAQEIIESSQAEFTIAREDEDDLEEIIDSLWVNYIAMGAEVFLESHKVENTYQADDEFDKGYNKFLEWFERDVQKVIMSL